MEPDVAILTIRSNWLSLGYQHFIVAESGGHKLTDDLIYFEIGVLDTHGGHGILVESARADSSESKARAFIPWRYVEGILWLQDTTLAIRRIGFSSGSDNSSVGEKP
jgi:hypothetical protein